MNYEKIIENTVEYMEQFTRVASEQPDSIAMIDGASGNQITYGELDRLSGKVYRSLKDQGIGREDVVMIRLPRGISPYIAMLGVWKAGAACTILEIDYPQEKTDYIYQDAGCKMLIDGVRYAEMMSMNAMDGWERADIHDLAMILYTSGTTGNPKGVMHEYGTLRMHVLSASYEDTALVEENDRLALVSPLNFAASYMAAMSVFYMGASMLIIPMNIVKNPGELVSTMQKYEATMGLFTPSLARFIKEFYPGFRKLALAGESVGKLDLKGIDIYSTYAQTESTSLVFTLKLENLEEIAPMGRNRIDPDYTVLQAEDGSLVEGEGEGELCYYQPFFRGYLGFEELTAAIKENGLVHTGDLLRRNRSGELYFLGRMDDMVKINGNRVEPAEIDHALVEVLGVEWAAAKVVHQDGRSYVCAYYQEEPRISIEAAEQALREKLVDYMVPTRFVKIERIPLNANGKFSRRLLPDPERQDLAGGYVPPTNEIERAICRAMEKVLNVEGIGRTHDFFALGGDSLASIALITELALEGLEASLIFGERTPERIASAYETIRLELDEGSMEEKNRLAEVGEFPLNMSQLNMFDVQLYFPKSTIWNLPVLLHLESGTNMDRLADAIRIAMEHHPAFSTVFCFNEESELIQKRKRDVLLKVEVEKTTEDEFRAMAQELVQPFHLIDRVLYHVRIFETEHGGYLFLDFHHCIADGTSIMLFLHDIAAAYAGQALAPDYYYLDLARKSGERETPLYEEGRAYFEKLLDGKNWSTHPRLDHITDARIYDEVELTLDLSPSLFKPLHARFGLSPTTFFMAVCMLAISAYNKEENIKLSWISNGRDSVLQNNLFGPLLRECYLGIEMQDQMNLQDYLSQILEQVRMTMKYSCYTYPGPERITDIVENASMVYHGELYSMRNSGELHMDPVEIPGLVMMPDNHLDIDIRTEGDRHQITLQYNAARYNRESMERFAVIMQTCADLIVEHAEKGEVTLSSLRSKINNSVR